MICYISLKINWTFWGFGLLVLKVANVSALFFRKCYFRDHFLTTYTHIGLLKSGITDHQSIRNTGRSFICILGSPVAQLIFSVTAIYCMSTFIKKKHSEVSKLLLFHSYVNSCVKCFFFTYQPMNDRKTWGLWLKACFCGSTNVVAILWLLCSAAPV